MINGRDWIQPAWSTIERLALMRYDPWFSNLAVIKHDENNNHCVSSKNREMPHMSKLITNQELPPVIVSYSTFWNLLSSPIFLLFYMQPKDEHGFVSTFQEFDKISKARGQLLCIFQPRSYSNVSTRKYSTSTASRMNDLQAMELFDLDQKMQHNLYESEIV